MVDCISKNYKNSIINMLNRNLAKEVIAAVITDVMPACEDVIPDVVSTAVAAARATQKEASTRKAVMDWPAATYYDEKGKKTPWNSPSALFKALFGVSPSTNVECAIVEGETKCSPASMVQSFQARGMIVRGNGEPPPVITQDMGRSERTASHETWKQHLRNTNMSFIVYHPKSPQAKKMDKEEA